jgi:iron uptake system component EfeO
MVVLALAAALLAGVSACGDPRGGGPPPLGGGAALQGRSQGYPLPSATSSSADSSTRAALLVKGRFTEQVDRLYEAVLALQAAAPEPDADGWSAASDGEAVARMRRAWLQARAAYVEAVGVFLGLFPERRGLDQRYESLAFAEADDNLFDGEGFVGFQAVERILYADVHPGDVVASESLLPGYRPARFPSSASEAQSFKGALLGRLVSDVQQVRDELAAVVLDLSAVYRLVVLAVRTQPDLLARGGTPEASSSYSGTTLADMKSTLRAAHALFDGFSQVADGSAVLAGADRPEIYRAIQGCFQRVLDGIEQVTVDSAIPARGEGWSDDGPPVALLDTPYGRLWSLFQRENDRATPATCMAQLVLFAARMGIDPFWRLPAGAPADAL